MDASTAVSLSSRVDAIEKRLENGWEPLNESSDELAQRIRFMQLNETPVVRSTNWRFLYGVIAPLGTLLLVLGMHLVLPRTNPEN